MKRFWVVAVLGVLSFFPIASFADDSVYEPIPAMEYPSDNKWSKEKEVLGKMLYFDPRLSGSNWISCATCHNPGLGWGDGLPRTIGDGQKELGRHAPTVINSGYFALQMWDGRKKTLEDQASGPIGAAGEMNQDYGELIRELQALPDYVNRFDKVFGKFYPYILWDFFLVYIPIMSISHFKNPLKPLALPNRFCSSLRL